MEEWDKLRQLAKQKGFHRHGVAEITRPLSIEFYKSWLDQGRGADMDYLRDHLASKENPSSYFPKAKSALVVALDYLPHPAPLQNFPFKALKVAAYAKGKDYHHWFKARLDELCSEFKTLHPDNDFIACTDSKPVLERDLAYRAGLGWVGKNTCLIDKNSGSFFLLGEIISTLPAPTPEAISPDHCGTCNRCIEACPTGAITAAKNLDARLCISYWTIESKHNAPENLRENFSGWLFGCDICQNVCPWNIKFHRDKLREPEPSREQMLHELQWLLSASHREIDRSVFKSPLQRPGALGLKKNALLICVSIQAVELKSHIAALLEHKRLGDLAKWALEHL